MVCVCALSHECSMVCVCVLAMLHDKGRSFPRKLTSGRPGADIREQEKMREKYFEQAVEWETSSGIWLFRIGSYKKGALLM